MRVTTVRKESEAPYSQDLRGLGDVLSQGSPYSLLVISNLNADHIERSIKTFDCVVAEKHSSTSFGISTRKIEEGQFKKQAVQLFSLALIIAENHPSARMSLYISRSNEPKITNANFCLEIDEGVHFALTQATFRIDSKILTHDKISEMLKEIKAGTDTITEFGQSSALVSNAG